MKRAELLGQYYFLSPEELGCCRENLEEDEVENCGAGKLRTVTKASRNQHNITAAGMKSRERLPQRIITQSLASETTYDDWAADGKLPYQVSLEISGTSICGGSIIDDTHVMSAAHCFAGPDGRFYNISTKVIIHNHNKSAKIISSNVEKVYIPKMYTQGKPHTHLEGDIAVLKLKKPLETGLQQALGKLDLPEENGSYTNETAMVTGFGRSWARLNGDPSADRSEMSDGTNGKLRFANITVLSPSQCQAIFPVNITDVHICAQEQNNQLDSLQSSCSSDGGGPLVHKHKTLIGVMSTSPLGCSEREAPRVYTKVSTFLDFVEKAMKDKPDSSMILKELPS